MGHIRSPQVDSDLDDIWYYVATSSGNVEIADRLIEAIVDRFLLLARHPHAGRKREEFGPGLRSFPVGEYVIFYRVQEGDIRVLRVLRGSRDIESILLH